MRPTPALIKMNKAMDSTQGYRIEYFLLGNLSGREGRIVGKEIRAGEGGESCSFVALAVVIAGGGERMGVACKSLAVNWGSVGGGIFCFWVCVVVNG